MPSAPATRERRSIRLPEYDYALPGAYFVTICTDDRQPFFDVEAMRQIAERCWLSLPQHFSSAELDEWVVMPNHIHGIVAICEDGTGRGVQLNAPTRRPDNRLSAISPHRRTLGVIIRTFKAAVTGGCRRAGLDFGWQRNYYEHIVRDEADLERIRAYIRSNPLLWESDEDNPATWVANPEVAR